MENNDKIRQLNSMLKIACSSIEKSIRKQIQEDRSSELVQEVLARIVQLQETTSRGSQQRRRYRNKLTLLQYKGQQNFALRY